MYPPPKIEGWNQGHSDIGQCAPPNQNFKKKFKNLGMKPGKSKVRIWDRSNIWQAMYYDLTTIHVDLIQMDDSPADSCAISPTAFLLLTRMCTF